MAHGLHVVVTVDYKRLRTTTTLAVNNWIAGADAKRARTDADSLHRLLNCFGNGAHARSTRGDRGHAAEALQTLRKTARVAIYITIKFDKGHHYCDCQLPISDFVMLVPQIGNRQLAIRNEEGSNKRYRD